MFNLLVVLLLLFLISLVLIYVASDKVKRIKLKESKIIITGGSDGLGLEISKLLVKNGSHLAIISRNEKKLKNSMDILLPLKKDDQKLKTFRGDVSNEESINDAIQKAIEYLGGVDILINNAGITYPGRFDDVEQYHYNNVMNVNYYGHIYAIRSVLPTMKAQKHGRIIGVASLVALFGVMGYSTYAPTKAAIRSLYELLHQEYYHYNIAFSVVIPGSIRTESFEEEQKIKPKETLELELDDPIHPPDMLAKSIVNNIENWKFYISPSGFNGDASMIVCRGFSPFSFMEGVSQVYLSGIMRLVSMLLFNLKAKNISKKIRQQE